jgi:hypothetical protein
MMPDPTLGLAVEVGEFATEAPILWRVKMRSLRMVGMVGMVGVRWDRRIRRMFGGVDGVGIYVSSDSDSWLS